MLADRPHGRRLTAAEQMRLEQLERQLRDDDPQLAEAFSIAPEPRVSASPGRVGLLAGAATLAIVLVLFAALIGGAGGAVAVAVALLAAFAGWRYLQHRRRR